MRSLFLIALLTFGALAQSTKITLIGLSGTKTNINAIVYDNKNQESDIVDVEPYSIWERFYLNRAQRGDTLVCEYQGRHLYIIEGHDSAFVDSNAFALTHPLYLQKKKHFLAVADFARLMSALAQELVFTFDSSSLELLVTKKLDKKIPKEVTSQVTASLFVPKDTLAPDTIDHSPLRKLSWSELSGVVVLDPGHGGKDPGAIGPDSATEKEVVLAIALKAQSFIQRNSGVTALLTRSDDTFIPLRGRTRFANSKNAQLFVSIHANATEDGRARGYKMYFLSEAKNQSDQRTALLENAVMEFEEEEETDMVHSILLDMMSSEFLVESQELSIEFAQTFSKRLPTRKLHTGIGQANFYVLHGATMPAVLVETAFISNPKEEKLLIDPAFQRKMGDAIGRAVLNFLQEMSVNHE